MITQENLLKSSLKSIQTNNVIKQSINDVVIASAELNASALPAYSAEEENEQIEEAEQTEEFVEEEVTEVASNYQLIYENNYRNDMLETYGLQNFLTLNGTNAVSTDIINERSMLFDGFFVDNNISRLTENNTTTINSELDGAWCGTDELYPPYTPEDGVYRRYSGGHEVNLGDEDNVVTIFQGANSINTNGGDDKVTLFGGGNLINTGEGDDHIVIFGSDSNKSLFVYNLNDGNDFLYGAANIEFGTGISLKDLSLTEHVIDIANQGSIQIYGLNADKFSFADGGSISYEDFFASFGQQARPILAIDPAPNLREELYLEEFGTPLDTGSSLFSDAAFMAEADIPIV